MAWQWKDLGTPTGQDLSGGPLATASYQGIPHVFVPGSDGNLWVNWRDTHEWKWKDLGTPPGRGIDGAAMATASHQGKPHVFVFGSDGNLWVNWRDTHEWKWKDLGTPPVQHPEPDRRPDREVIATASYQDSPYVFVFGSDRHVWASWLDGGTWRWNDHGTPPGVDSQARLPSQKGPSPDFYVPNMATASHQGKPYVFSWAGDFDWQGDRHLWVHRYDGSQWHWKDLDAPPVQHPERDPSEDSAAIATASYQGSPYAFVFGSDGHLWTNWWDSHHSEWRWNDLGTAPGQHPQPEANHFNTAAIATASHQGRPMVFTKILDGHVWVDRYDGSQWHWEDHGISPNRDDNIIATASYQGMPYAFVIGSDSHLWVNWLSQ
jgi:hypothetical protein